LDEELAWWLGAVVGDGSYRDHRDGRVDLASQDHGVLTRARSLLEGYGLRVGTYQRLRPPLTRLYVSSWAFRAWLEVIGLRFVTGPHKSVPEPVFRARAAVRAAFLRGLFDTDGSAEAGATRSCRFVTSSLQLAAEVQQLLLSLGIVASRSRVTERAWCVAVSGTTLEVFAARVGFSVQSKAARLAAALAGRHGRHAGHVRGVPFGRLIAREFSTVLHQQWGPTQGRRGRGILAGVASGRPAWAAPLRTAYRTALEHGRPTYGGLDHLRRGLEEDVVAAAPLLRQTMQTRHFSDRIVSIEYPADRVRMLDVEVDGDHSFVTGGFVSHNCQGSEFPAVVILLLMKHAPMLGRTLLYTALTRARQLVVIVGQKRALTLAVKDWRRVARSTALAGLLTGSIAYAWPRSQPPDSDASDDLEVWEGLMGSPPDA
jgi:hypothetical protein